jgi:hypothetical protein
MRKAIVMVLMLLGFCGFVKGQTPCSFQQPSNTGRQFQGVTSYEQAVGFAIAGSGKGAQALSQPGAYRAEVNYTGVPTATAELIYYAPTTGSADPQTGVEVHFISYVPGGVYNSYSYGLYVEGFAPNEMLSFVRWQHVNYVTSVTTIASFSIGTVPSTLWLSLAGGSAMTASYSTDGVNYTTLGTDSSAGGGNLLQIEGLFASTGDNTNIFNQVTVAEYNNLNFNGASTFATKGNTGTVGESGYGNALAAYTFQDREVLIPSISIFQSFACTPTQLTLMQNELAQAQFSLSLVGGLSIFHHAFQFDIWPKQTTTFATVNCPSTPQNPNNAGCLPQVLDGSFTTTAIHNTNQLEWDCLINGTVTSAYDGHTLLNNVNFTGGSNLSPFNLP